MDNQPDEGQADSYTIAVLEQTSFFSGKSEPKVQSAFSVRLFRLDDELFILLDEIGLMRRLHP